MTKLSGNEFSDQIGIGRNRNIETDRERERDSCCFGGLLGDSSRDRGQSDSRLEIPWWTGGQSVQ